MKLISLTLLFLLLLLSCKTESLEKENIEKEDDTITLDLPLEKYKPCLLSDLGLDTTLGSPNSITDAVALINALPKPLTIACFISSLQRPLKINLTTSKKSVQPAIDSSNPRIFIMNFPLIISINIKGDKSYIMEFSEFTSDQTSIKAELLFPIAKNILESTPFDRIDDSGARSACLGCHMNEEKIDSAFSGNIYESTALKPEPETLLSVSEFSSQIYNCDIQETPSRRCHLIYSLFNQGDVEHESFPENTPTFFESFKDDL